ncbi:MAG: fibronectin type III, partial [Spirosomataceae bacterium]
MKFRVQLLLKDLTKPSVSVSLQIRLKGQGVWLQNPEGFLASQPITLTPGIPKTISAVELGEYFSPQNIEAQGIDYQQLLNGLSLPFGFYEWEVIAIEQDRFRQVSNTGTAKFFVQNNYPPILNMPANGSIVPTTTPQNILFSWTPRHQSPPLGRGGLVYELYLYEIPDASINSAADIQALINSGTPYMQELLSDKPNFIYGPTGLPLTVGSTYAWQVRAVSLDGETGFFNNGYSDIKSFVYGHLPCPQPSNLVAKVDADEGSVQLSWDAPTDALSYKLAFYTLPNGMKTEKSVLEPTFL